MSKPTKGPWRIKEDCAVYNSVWAPDGEVANTHSIARSFKTQEANALLIAAAPELLEQLKTARRQLYCNGMTDEELAPIDAALAKAERGE